MGNGVPEHGQEKDQYQHGYGQEHSGLVATEKASEHSFGRCSYLRAAPSLRTMQQIFFAIGHFLQWSFKIITSVEWLPVTLITVIMIVGSCYWLLLQSRYNKRARANGTTA